MAQTIVPISTFEDAGLPWTITGAASHHLAVDETIASADDNTTKITSPTSGGIGNRVVFVLGTAPETGDTDPNGTYRIRARHKRNASSLIQPICNVDLYNSTGTVFLARLQFTSTTHTAFNNAEHVLTSGEVAAVGTDDGDWDSLVLVVYQPGTGGTQAQDITALELELPSVLPVLELTRVGVESFALTLALVEADVTRATAEVLAEIQTPRLSRFGAEVLASHAIVRSTRLGLEAMAGWASPRVTRFGVEAFATTGILASLGLTRSGLEVMGNHPDARLSRICAEIAAARNVPRVTRLGIETMASWSEPRLTRLGVEAFAINASPSAQVSRQMAEVILSHSIPRVTHYAAEVLAERVVSSDTLELTRLVAELWAKVSQENVVHRVNCGGSEYSDGDGHTWDADRDFTGGLTFSTSDPISNTADPTLYQTERYGTFFYSLPVPDGTYTVRLHLAELFHQASGQRVFDVAINGTTVETGIDIFAEVGHDVAMIRSYGATASGGTGITINFSATVDEAKVGAIEIISSAPAADSAHVTRFAAEAFGNSHSLEGAALTTRQAVEVFAEAQYPTLVTRVAGEVMLRHSQPRVSRAVAEVLGTIAELDEAYCTRLAAEVWAKSDTPSTTVHHRIKSGATVPFVDSFGNTWDADRDFVGVSDFFATVDPITGTPDPELYQDERYGVAGSLWGYELDVPGPGTYRVRVHLAEIFHEVAGARVFDVEINGVTVEAGIDIFAEVGHDAALIREYQVVIGAASALTLAVYFRTQVDAGKCSAIEVLEDVVLDRADVTRFAAEVFGERAGTLLTRLGAEVFATTIADTVLATRAGAEVLAAGPQNAQVTRLVAEILGNEPKYAQISRIIAEVASSGTVPARLTRIAAELFGTLGPDAEQVDVSRFCTEVFARNPKSVQTTRLVVEAFARWIQSNDTVRATRIGAEVFARVLGQTPFSPLELAASDLFIANWRDDVVIDSWWNTDITNSTEELAEERISLVDRPYRKEQVTLTGLNVDQANRLLSLAQRHGKGRLTCPLHADFSKVTAPSGGTVIFCDTADRRFFAGGRIVIHGWVRAADGRLNTANAAYAIIQQVTGSALVLTEPLANVYDRGDRVMPVIDTELQATSEVAIVGEDTAELALAVSEVIGQSALPPLVVGGSMPPQAPTYRGEPVFLSSVDWQARITSRHVTETDQVDIGRGLVINPKGERARIEQVAQYLQLQRSSAFRVLRFFDSRRGRTDSFYFVGHSAFWKLLDVGTYHVDVEPVNTVIEEQQANFPFVTLRLYGGTVFLREIAELRDIGGGRWRMTFAEPLPALEVSAVQRVSSGHHVRFVADTIRERWSTDETCKISLGVVDLLAEGDVEIDIPPLPTTFDGIGDVPDLHLWLDAAKGLFNGQKVGSRFNYPIPAGWYVTAWDDARHDPSPETSSNPCAFGRIPTETQSPKAWNFSPGTNRGQRAVYSQPSAPFTETKLYLMTGNTHAENSPGDSLDLPYWDDSLGLTVFWCGSLAGKKTDVSFFRSYGSHDWNFTELKLFTTKGVDNPPSWATYDDVSDFAGVQILVARWVPATSVRVWQHGIEIGSSTVSPGTLDPNVDGHGATEPSSIVLCELGDGSWSNAFLIFKRALTMNEMNAIGQILSQRYGAPWNDVLN